MEESEIRTKMNQKFTDLLDKKERKSNSALLTNDRYMMLMKDVKRAKGSHRKVPRDYWLLQHYDVLAIKGTDKLIVPMKATNSEVVYYVSKNDLFDVLYDVHLATGHGGRDRMVKELNKKYKNVTREQIKSFLGNCEACQQKKKSEEKGVVVKAIASQHSDSRCQVDLIDFQSHPDDNYKFIMVYQDHLTKFVVLKPLKTKRAEEVASLILEIFLLFGAPNILQSYNGREFCNKMIVSLRSMWPELKIVNGKPRHSQNEDSLEKSNQDVENMLVTWMEQNDTKKWSKGLHFVQFMKNRAYHSGIKTSPYKAMFGVDPKVGLTTSSLPKDIIDSLQDEEDQNKVLQIMERETEEQNIKPDNTRRADCEEIEKIECVIDLETWSDSYSHCTDNVKPAHSRRSIETFNRDADGMDQNRRCVLCRRKMSIINEDSDAKEGLCQQAKKMKTTSDRKHPSAAIGSTVRLKVPDVDRGRGDPRTILAIVLDFTDDDNLYKLGTRDGIIKQLYARSQFSVCDEKLLSVEEVPSKEISLRAVATAQSFGIGQSFKKCVCTKKCETNKCLCKKNNLLCNSKCHSSGPCTNK